MHVLVASRLSSCALALTLLVSTARAEVVLFTNAAYTSQFGATEAYRQVGTVLNWELGEDFEAHGLVTRLYVQGHNPSFSQPLTPTGINVRFYALGATAPGALLSSQFIPATDPGFVLGQSGSLDLKLLTPFAADGSYFVSFQMVFDQPQGWYCVFDWDNLVLGSPQIDGLPAKVRSHANGFTWSDPLWVGTNIQVQVRFTLFGEDGTPPDLGSDPCGVWSPIPTPDPSPTNHAILRDVFMIGPNDAWAVGEALLLNSPSVETVPIAMHWDGSSWTMIPTPIPAPFPGGANCGFYDVAAAGPNDVWAAGWQTSQDAAGYVGTHMMVQHWDGSQWSLVPTPATSTIGLQGVSGDVIRGIEVIAPNDIWFVGDWVEILQLGPPQPALAMHWDGSSFTIHDTPYFSNGGHGLESVSANGPNDVWAVGGSGDGDWANFSYAIHWDGSSWSQVSLATPGIIQRLFAVEAIAPNDVWACGQSQIGNDILAWFVHWNGASWTQVPSPGGTLGLHAFASDDVYSAGGGVFHWDGSAWSKVSGDLGAAVGVSYGGIHGDAPCSLLAVGREVAGGDLLTASARLVPSTWQDHGGAIAGPAGSAPALTGQGTLLTGDPLVLRVLGAKPLAPGVLFIGAAPLGLPAYGGLFWPQPDFAIAGLLPNAAGALSLFAEWPAPVPSGFGLHLQFWQADAAASAGVTATNGLSATAP